MKYESSGISVSETARKKLDAFGDVYAIHPS